ncbi:MAG: hypothetical protein K6A91_06275 [Clostridia bacterium]|nr:hypothetical protein [Clostridia bacterium]
MTFEERFGKLREFCKTAHISEEAISHLVYEAQFKHFEAMQESIRRAAEQMSLIILENKGVELDSDRSAIVEAKAIRDHIIPRLYSIAADIIMQKDPATENFHREEAFRKEW